MKVVTLAKGFVLSVVLLIAVGCASTSPEFPTGEFVDTEGNTINYKADGRVTFSVPEAAGEQISGEYSVEGDTITSSEGFCPDDAVYKWSFDGERLEFELVRDDCAERRALMAGGLTRVSEDS
ncbi:MAG: hypothetical protein ACE5NC_01015 [Anaerolineae bacterium]